MQTICAEMRIIMNIIDDKKTDPTLSREDAIAILNTPDDALQELIDRASALRYKYKGNRVSIHILTNARSWFKWYEIHRSGD